MSFSEYRDEWIRALCSMLLRDNLCGELTSREPENAAQFSLGQGEFCLEYWILQEESGDDGAGDSSAEHIAGVMSAANFAVEPVQFGAFIKLCLHLRGHVGQKNGAQGAKCGVTAWIRGIVRLFNAGMDV